MKRLIVLFSVVCLSTQTYGQSIEEMRAKFNSFVTQIEEKHSDFRNSINAKYADFIRETWTKHAPEAPIPTPSKPEPPEQPIYVPAPQEPDKPEPKPQPIPIDDVVTIPQPEEKPQPVEPIVEPKRPITVSIEVDFFGRKCQISLDKSAPLTLSNNNEEGVASAWEELSKDKYNTMLNECLALRDELKLCDWAYIQLAQAVTREQYGSDKCDAAIVTQAYILVQSGYKVRMGRVGGNLTLLLPSSEPIYGMTYINLKGQKYYVLCEVGDEDTIGLCDASFPNEKIFSLYVSEQPMLPMHQVEERVFRSVKLGGDGITLAVNRNLMNFYGTYPNCEWNIHAMASLSDEIKEQLYAYLRPAIEGKNAEAAANILINFVQTGFSYKTDEEQFGYERPLFGDETFFYPYSDCEDRAILFSILIRDLMGLDVVLLNYPEHLATAVHFKDDIQGDYIELNDKKYLVCDPTYINAEIGLTMPDMYGQQVRIIQL